MYIFLFNYVIILIEVICQMEPYKAKKLPIQYELTPELLKLLCD